MKMNTNLIIRKSLTYFRNDSKNTKRRNSFYKNMYIYKELLYILTPHLLIVNPETFELKFVCDKLKDIKTQTPHKANLGLQFYLSLNAQSETKILKVF